MGTVMEVIVFGGTFDPFGAHHRAAVQWLHENRGDKTTQIWVMPAIAHATKDQSTISSYKDRVALARLGVRGIPNVLVSTLEREALGDRTHLITYDLLSFLRKLHPTYGFKFAVGEDLLPNIPFWDKGLDVEREFGFVVIPDAKGVHASDIRRMAREGHPDWPKLLAEPKSQYKYIQTHGMYA